MEQEQIKKLTKRITELDLSINKTKKQLSIMEFLTERFGYTTKGSAIAISFFFVGLLSALVMPQNLLWLSSVLTFVPSLTGGAAMLYINVSLKKKKETLLKELLEEREEVKKQIKCIETGETYVPKQTEEKEDVYDRLIELMTNSQKEKKESLEKTSEKLVDVNDKGSEISESKLSTEETSLNDNSCEQNDVEF